MFEPMSPILTVPDGRFGRVPTDVGSTGFFLGQEFRLFFEFNIPVGESRWIRVTVPVDFTLKLQTFSVDQGRCVSGHGVTAPTRGHGPRLPARRADISTATPQLRLSVDTCSKSLPS